MKTPLHFNRYDCASFLTFMTYAFCSLIIPVTLYPLASDMHFPLDTDGKGLGGALQLGRSIPMVGSMLFCGFLAAKWGKARTMGLSLLVMGTGIMLAGFSPGYFFLFGTLALAGLGEGIIEGIATPFIQDQHPEEPGRYINFTHGFWSVGVAVVVLAAGWLLWKGVSWRILVTVTGAVSLLPALLFFWPDRKKLLKGSPTDSASIRKIGSDALAILKTPRFWPFFAAMFMAGGGEYCLTFWTTSFIRLEYAGANMFEGGIGTACFSLGMIGGRLGTGFLLRQEQLKKTILWTALAAVLLSVPFPGIRSLAVLFPMLFLLGIATGPFWPSIQSFSADCLPKADITMLFVLLSCAGVPGCGFFSMLMGVVGDWAGLRPSFILVPFCFAVMGLFVVWGSKKNAERIKKNLTNQ